MQQSDDNPQGGVWLSWRRAVRHVERGLGLSWGAALKELLEAYNQSKLTCRPGLDGPDVWDVDLRRWLSPPKSQSVAWQQLRVIRHLTKMFPNGVPDRSHCRRKDLLAELRERDPLLKSLNEKTLKYAIDEYNLLFGIMGNARNLTVSD